MSLGAFVSILILIWLTYYHWVRSALMALICWFVLPMETEFDVTMFFVTWMVLTLIACMTFRHWAGFGIGFGFGSGALQDWIKRKLL